MARSPHAAPGAAGKEGRNLESKQGNVTVDFRGNVLILTRWYSLPIFVAFGVALFACDHEKDSAKVRAQTPAPTASTDAPAVKLSLLPDQGPPPTIDGARAMRYVKEIVAFGPRPLGSANHKKVEDYLLAHLTRDD